MPAVNKTKKAIRKAFEYSLQNKGTSMVEVVSSCSAGWKMTPQEANDWMRDNMFLHYPLGDLKDKQ
jgi:2-oxoglutarate ferredoxin oxidoreductase subunit beta